MSPAMNLVEKMSVLKEVFNPALILKEIVLKCPVVLTKNLEIVDSDNQTVVPSIFWKGDIYHKQRQECIGRLIVSLINDCYEDYLDEIDSSRPRRGNPNWFKGMASPRFAKKEDSNSGEQQVA